MTNEHLFDMILNRAHRTATEDRAVLRAHFPHLTPAQIEDILERRNRR